MRYLIDGYNLMHAKGLLNGKFQGPALHHARLRLLAQVRSRLEGVDASKITVVFDAANPPPGREARTMHHGLNVRYAVGHENADALIEVLLKQESTPRTLTVVSSDHRIREAARRRGATSIDSDQFWSGLFLLRLKSGGAGSTSAASARQNARTLGRNPTIDPAESRQLEQAFAEADDLLAREPMPGSTSRSMLRQDELERLEAEFDREGWEP